MKNILIIGGSSGIGKYLAENLSAEHHIIATYRNHEIKNENIKSYQLDVTKDYLDLDLPEVLDGVVYCPGNISLKPFTRFSPEDFLKDYELQFLGAVKILQYAMPNLKKSANASVVLFSSVAAQKGFAFHSLVAPHKAALEGFTKAMAAEYAPKIRFNCIAPSLTQTNLSAGILSNEEKIKKMGELNPMKRVGQPQDIGDFASYLLSDKASWITGQIFHIDGGSSVI